MIIHTFLAVWIMLAGIMVCFLVYARSSLLDHVLDLLRLLPYHLQLLAGPQPELPLFDADRIDPFVIFDFFFIPYNHFLVFFFRIFIEILLISFLLLLVLVLVFSDFLFIDLPKLGLLLVLLLQLCRGRWRLDPGECAVERLVLFELVYQSLFKLLIFFSFGLENSAQEISLLLEALIV